MNREQKMAALDAELTLLATRVIEIIDQLDALKEQECQEYLRECQQRGYFGPGDTHGQL